MQIPIAGWLAPLFTMKRLRGAASREPTWLQTYGSGGLFSLARLVAIDLAICMKHLTEDQIETFSMTEVIFCYNREFPR